MIDGFRYGFIGRSDGSVLVGVDLHGWLLAVRARPCSRVLQIFRTGWRLKS